jgi:hypothetical protein
MLTLQMHKDVKNNSVLSGMFAFCLIKKKTVVCALQWPVKNYECLIF